MNNSVVAHIRTPNDDELKRIRELWSALKQKSLPASTDIGIELQTYLNHAVRMIGIIAGLHPITGKPAISGQFPLRVSAKTVLHAFTTRCTCALQSTPCGPRIEAR
jgi:hypothetical protein